MNNVKRVIFDVKSAKNIFWDDTPIRVGALLTIPDKFKGDQPLCIISHGSGGLGSDTDLFVDSLGKHGIATLCVDSFTGRSMEAIGWNDFSSYVSPKMRAMETVEAYKFICANHKNMFAGIDLQRIAFVGFSWGADTVANVIAHYNEVLPKKTFFSLCYGNLWPFEPEFYKAKDWDVTCYHGADDLWTSAEKSKLFAQETNSEFVEFMGVTHGFTKPGYSEKIAKQVMINHHAEFPVPTDLKQVYSWIQKGKIWEDTDWKKVDAPLDYDQMATERVLADIVNKLKS